MTKRIRLKYLGSAPITNGLGLSGAFDDPAWPRYIRTTDIGDERSLRDDTFASQPPAVAAAATVLPRDILMTAAGTIGKSYLHYGSDPACFAGYLARFRPREDIDERFISHWMQSADYWAQIEMGAVRSTIDNFSAGKYRQLLVPEIPLGSQRRIADFLDDQVARIDEIIRLREEQIDAVIQRQHLTISRLFVPSDETPPTRVKYLLTARPSYGVLVPRYANGFDAVTFIRVGNLPHLAAPIELPTISSAQSREYARTQLTGGEVLLGVVGKMGTATVAAPWVRGANVARAVAVLRCQDQWTAHLLCAWFGSGQFLRQATTATSGDSVQPTLGMGDLANFIVCWPGNVQSAAHLASDILETGLNQRREMRAQIALLQERKRSLITAAVTGEFDVSAASGRGVT